MFTRLRIRFNRSVMMGKGPLRGRSEENDVRDRLGELRSQETRIGGTRPNMDMDTIGLSG